MGFLDLEVIVAGVGILGMGMGCDGLLGGVMVGKWAYEVW